MSERPAPLGQPLGGRSRTANKSSSQRSCITNGCDVPGFRQELAAQETLFPAVTAIPFGPVEAARAASLYHTVPRARGREPDLAIAACALEWDAELWTLNLQDVDDLPGLVARRP